jgi:hypothetical protein
VKLVVLGIDIWHCNDLATRGDGTLEVERRNVVFREFQTRVQVRVCGGRDRIRLCMQRHGPREISRVSRESSVGDQARDQAAGILGRAIQLQRSRVERGRLRSVTARLVGATEAMQSARLVQAHFVLSRQVQREAGVRSQDRCVPT